METLQQINACLEAIDNYYMHITACLIMLLFCGVVIIMILIALIVSNKGKFFEEDQLERETEATYRFLNDWDYRQFLKEKEEKRNDRFNELQRGAGNKGPKD